MWCVGRVRLFAGKARLGRTGSRVVLVHRAHGHDREIVSGSGPNRPIHIRKRSAHQPDGIGRSRPNRRDDGGQRKRRCAGVSPIPNLIWPDDRSWCVATDIDQDTTYVGGSSRLVDDLVRCDSLEVHEVRADDGITEDSDRINPPAPERRASIRLVQEKTFWELELEEDARRLFGSPWWWRSVSRLRTFWRARRRWRVRRSR